MAASMSASTAFMAARLISKLSLNHQDEPVDLGNLCCLKNGFVAPQFYLIGKVNTARALNFDSFQSVVRSMWRLSAPVKVQERGDRFLFSFTNERDVARVEKGGPWSYQHAMILLNDYDGFSDLMVVPLDFVWIWVDIHELPAALTTPVTAQLVGETIGPVLKVYECGINNGLVRVHLTLPLHDPVRLERRIRVSPKDVITEPPSPVVSPAIQPAAPPMMVFRGNTHVSFSVPQVADLASTKEKRSVSIREVPDFPSPSKIIGVQRGREEEDDDGGKRERHSLVMVPLPLNPNELGFSIAADGILSIVRTGKSPKKRGPHGSKNKEPNLIENSDSMAFGPAMGEKANALESEED
ncbi:hypothetical protein ACLB2K_028393 [Fragaria x ananassa]